ncbi:hypothetical protein [Leptospira brenneri]|uniref:hypothetical protein n=1 Tax=Leptospira brenneri TaxID=2023182 RepID=UPI001FCB5FFD|nr:hypothetical protein [Leptospira brenneri]
MFGTRQNTFYEIHRSPGQQEKHTLYVIGVEGDMVAQYSRPDAILLNQMASNGWMVNPFCKGVNIDCDTYWKNRTNFALISFLEDTNLYVDMVKLEKAIERSLGLSYLDYYSG